jgi:hypothetical protein
MWWPLVPRDFERTGIAFGPLCGDRSLPVAPRACRVELSTESTQETSKCNACWNAHCSAREDAAVAACASAQVRSTIVSSRRALLPRVTLAAAPVSTPRQSLSATAGSPPSFVVSCLSGHAPLLTNSRLRVWVPFQRCRRPWDLPACGTAHSHWLELTEPPDADELPACATHKALKRELIRPGAMADTGTLWTPRGQRPPFFPRCRFEKLRAAASRSEEA